MNFVLLRGIARESGHWGGFLSLLQNAPWCDRVLPLDLLGAGEYYDKNAPLQVEEYTNFLRQKYPLSGKWVLIGISFGGMIALDWYNRYPDTFHKLIIINSSAGNLSPFWRRMRPGRYLRLLRFILQYKNSFKREEMIFSMVSNLKGTDRDTVRQMASLQQKRPINRKNCLRQALAAGNYRLPKLDTLPIRIFASKKDRLVHPLCSIKMAKFLNSEIIWHPWAGHDIPLDDPHWLVEEIAKYVNS